jgi:hypothetical protein
MRRQRCETGDPTPRPTNYLLALERELQIRRLECVHRRRDCILVLQLAALELGLEFGLQHGFNFLGLRFDRLLQLRLRLVCLFTHADFQPLIPRIRLLARFSGERHLSLVHLLLHRVDVLPGVGRSRQQFTL